MEYEKLTAEDKKIIEYQIGKCPNNIKGVAKRCARNAPVLIINHPVVKNGGYSLFPVTFWLTCPNYKKCIYKLESGGWLKKISYVIADDADFTAALLTAHEEYSYIRMSLLSKDEYSLLLNDFSGLFDDLKKCGVGSTKNMDIVNCLHSHYGHYLATKINPVGALVETLLEELFLENEFCADCSGSAV